MHEDLHFEAGAFTVAGVDEVGRGAWAGPLTVGVAVVNSVAISRLPDGVKDSKMLTANARETLYSPITGAVSEYAIGHASANECDELGMTKAQVLATARAFDRLSMSVDAVIVDGLINFTPHANAQVLVGADRQCVVVAAASILAKVTRDRLMIAEAAHTAHYDFEHNKGYPAPRHLEGLSAFGLSSIHRRSWSFASGYET